MKTTRLLFYEDTFGSRGRVGERTTEPVDSSLLNPWPQHRHPLRAAGTADEPAGHPAAPQVKERP